MRIGIDASRAFQKERTGIEEYSYQVLKHLMDKLEGHQVVLYVRANKESKSSIGDLDSKLPNSWKIKVIKFPYLWTQIGLSLEMLFHPVDKLFVPAHVVPIIHPKNTIVTVHGLEFEVFSEGYSFLARLYMRWSIKFSCRAAKKIIAVSENTKRDLIRLYKVPEGKIEVIYEGVNKEQGTMISEQYKKYEPYLLFIGRLEKRKNIKGMVEAYKILKEKYGIPHKLILAGKEGLGVKDTKRGILNTRYKEDIIFPGFISDEKKFVLLQGADVFLFPSLYEGFGLPILEAQSMGVSVVTSNISSLPEVGGNSVIYCDPQSPNSIAEAAYSLISDQTLKNDIIKKGYENVWRFSWEDCSFRVSKIITNGNK